MPPGEISTAGDCRDGARPAGVSGCYESKAASRSTRLTATARKSRLPGQRRRPADRRIGRLGCPRRLLPAARRHRRHHRRRVATPELTDRPRFFARAFIRSRSIIRGGRKSGRRRSAPQDDDHHGVDRRRHEVAFSEPREENEGYSSAPRCFLVSRRNPAPCRTAARADRSGRFIMRCGGPVSRLAAPRAHGRLRCSARPLTFAPRAFARP